MAIHNHTTFELEGEEWRDIPGYEGMYQASNMGRIRGLDRTNHQGRKLRGTVLTPGVEKPPHGYLHVVLSKSGSSTTKKVHTLIAITFFGSCPSGYEINHKNGNKWDNSVNNLEYCTHAANMRHASENNLMHPKRNPKEKVQEIHERRRQGETLQSIGDRFGLTRERVRQILRDS